ncbi:MAG TPA: indole-3-glycerol-phosphate synthase TrpC, partial [Alphaproteobacteria bacterium]
MNDTLARIVSGKREEVARRRAARPIGEVERAARSASAPRGFAAALERAVAGGRYGLIAEI